VNEVLSMRLEPKQASVLAFAFVALSFVLRLICLNCNDIALDEPFTLYWANKSVGEISALAMDENNPPLYFLIQHYWMQFFGKDANVLRWPSLIFGLLTVFVLVRIAAKRISVFGALVTGIFISLSTEHLYYSQEVRAYTLLCLLTAIALDFLLKIIESPQEKANYYKLVIVSLLLAYTHYLSVWVFIAIAICWLFLTKPSLYLSKILIPVFVFFIGLLPLAWAAIFRLKHMTHTGTWVPEPESTQLYGHINIMLNGKYTTAVLLLIFLILGILALYKKALANILEKLKLPKDNLILLIWFVCLYFGLYFQSVVFQPVFIPRYLIFSSIPLFLLISVLLSAFARSGIQKLIVIVLLAITLIFSFDINPPNNRNMKDLVSAVNSFSEEHSSLIICPASFDMAFAYHAHPDLFYGSRDLSKALAERKVYAVNSFTEIPESVLRYTSDVVFLDADAAFTLPGNAILENLENLFTQENTTEVPGIFKVYKFGSGN
jgi:uncharacterized membrane protein